MYRILNWKGFPSKSVLMSQVVGEQYKAAFSFLF